jgi:enoyl-CoA hydratase
VPTTYETISSAADGPVTTITLRRPEALNAITPTMLGELSAALDEVAATGTTSVVVLTGEGRAFSAGVDLKALGQRSTESPERGEVGGTLNDRARRVTEQLGTLEAIAIAKINGFCFTGALELALGCDLIVTADEAVFGDTHATWGLRPTWGMSQRLPRFVGLARARELSYTARRFTGQEAAAWGLAIRSVPAAELDAAVAELAAQIAANSHGSLLAYKDLYRASERLALPDGLAYEADTSYEISDTGDRVSGFR